MNKPTHPISKLQRRKLVNVRKTNEEKKQEEETRAGRLRRKLSKEAILEQETEDELKQWRAGLASTDEPKPVL